MFCEFSARAKEESPMLGIALVCFIGLFGIVCGYRARD
jgi:hypothetical protein